MTGAAWFVAGLWVLRSFDNTVLAFVGVLMLLWAGLKAIILAFIYGAALYALLFRRDMFGAVAERRHIARVNARITRDLEAGQVDRAMDRIHGLLCSYPDNFGLRRRLGIYLIDLDRKADAGRFLMLHPDPTADERDAIRAFYKANGNDPYQILRKAVRSHSGPGFSKASQRILLQLYRSVEREADQQSWIYQAVGTYLGRAFPGRFWAVWYEYRAVIIEIAVFAVIIILFFILNERG